MKDSFSSLHPLVNLVYFSLVLIFGMFFMHPICILLSLTCGSIYYIKLKGKKGFHDILKFAVPIGIFALCINPIFNHRGATVLLYLKNGNPITEESLLYGLAAAAVLVSVILWFSSFNEIMTSDKLICLFGRIIPALSLIMSMILRFVPRFIKQFRLLKNAQKCIGNDFSSKKISLKMKQAFRLVSMMITWSLESSINTADSMKSRGYGLKGRTSYSVFRFELRDYFSVMIITFLGLFVFIGRITKILYWVYYPTLSGINLSFSSVLYFIAYAVLLLFPVIIDINEDLRWKHIQSKI